MTNETNKPPQNINFGKMSEYEKAEYVYDELLPALEKATIEELHRVQRQKLAWFEEKWKNVRLPRGVDRKTVKLIKPLTKSIHEMWFKGGLRLSRRDWISLGEQMALIIHPPMFRCYYLGYEMAAGNVERREGNDFLLRAVEPIEKFAAQITGTFVVKGRIREDEGISIVKKIVTRSIEAGNEHIILGIENYRKVGR